MIHFTITAGKSSFTTMPVGVVTGGYRLQVEYGDDISFSGSTTDGEELSGKVIAGNDLVLLRDDGVAVFDARVTFQAASPNSHLFEGEIRGRVDLKPVGFTRRIRSKGDWEQLKGRLNVILPIQFETATPHDVPPGSRFEAAAKSGARFVDLARHQFLAKGHFTIENGLITEAKLTIVSVADLADTVLSQLSDKGSLTFVRADLHSLIEKVKHKLHAALPDKKELLTAEFKNLVKAVDGSKPWDEVQPIIGRIRDSSRPPPPDAN